MENMTILPLDAVARLGSDPDAEHDMYRVAIGALDEAMTASDDLVRVWLDHEPRLTGNRRADALVAAVAEHVAFHRDAEIPRWTQHPLRSLASAWYPVDLPSIRTRAYVASPVSFARRLIYIDRLDLERV